MRIPIRLSLHRTPPALRHLIPCMPNVRDVVTGEFDPAEFSRYMSALLVRGTWRSTAGGRHGASDEAIVGLAREIGRPVVLDVGISDGSTSLDLIRKLGENLGRYHATDRDCEVAYRTVGAHTYLYDPGDGHCMLRASKGWMAYADTADALPALGAIADWLVAKAPPFDPERVERLHLIRPELLALAERDPRISVERYDAFEPWPGEPADLVKIANVLNPAYFGPDRIRTVAGNLREALREGGRLVVVDNRNDPASLRNRASEPGAKPVERFSIFRREGGALVLERTEAGGADATAAIVGDA